LQGGLAGATDIYGQAQQAIQGATAGANQAIAGGVTGANQALQNYLSQATGYLSPYMQAGAQGLTQLQAFMGPGGAGTTPFNASMMEAQDPGYQFRLQQGAQALQRSAAATGGVLGGAQEKALDRYSQDYASNEYQNAFNRYMAQNQQQYNMLAGLANYGQGAAGQAAGLTTNVGGAAAGNIYGGGLQTGQNFMQGGALQGNLFGQQAGANLTVGQQLANAAMQGNQYIGNIGLLGAQQAGNAYMQGAQGMASGILGQGNMLGQGLAGAAGQIGGGMMLNNLMNYLNPGGGGGLPPVGQYSGGGLGGLPTWGSGGFNIPLTGTSVSGDWASNPWNTSAGPWGG
jgi:hypothetical protein